MHEYSVVQALMEQIEMHAATHAATKITRVELALGRYCGVEPELLERAFETFKQTPLCHNAALVMQTVEGDEMVLMRLEMVE